MIIPGLLSAPSSDDEAAEANTLPRLSSSSQPWTAETTTTNRTKKSRRDFISPVKSCLVFGIVEMFPPRASLTDWSEVGAWQRIYSIPSGVQDVWGKLRCVGKAKISRSHFSSALRDLLREIIFFYVRLFSFFESNFNLEIFYNLIWTWSSSSRNRRTNKIVVCVPMSDWKKKWKVTLTGYSIKCFACTVDAKNCCSKVSIFFEKKKLHNME